MKIYLLQVMALLRGDPAADKVVPPSGLSARMTGIAAAAMAFLAVFSLALSLAAARVGVEWSGELSGSATVRISGPADQMVEQTAAVLAVLDTTPGVFSVHVLDEGEQNALLEPWLGLNIPSDVLAIPQLISLETDPAALDTEGLRHRLAGEVPGAVFDDHARWREPLVATAARLRLLALVAVLMSALAMAAMVSLAASAALAANAQVIATLRLIGARDTYIVRAFVRRITLRALAGSALGALLGAAATQMLPASGPGMEFLSGLALGGWEWLLVPLVPLIAGLVAFLATRAAAFAMLSRLT